MSKRVMLPGESGSDARARWLKERQREICLKRELANLEIVKQKAKNSELTIEELTNLVAIEELD